MKKCLNFWTTLCYVHWDINWIFVDSNDFWEKYDRDSENAEPRACADMQFTRHDDIKLINKALEKYKLSTSEFDEICTELEEKLSFWNCWWCI